MEGPAERIPPGAAPGGLVFRLFAGEELLDEGAMTGADAVEELGARHRYIALARGPGGGEIRCFIYDGDSGEALGTIIIDPIL